MGTLLFITRFSPKRGGDTSFESSDPAAEKGNTFRCRFTSQHDPGNRKGRPSAGVFSIDEAVAVDLNRCPFCLRVFLHETPVNQRRPRYFWGFMRLRRYSETECQCAVRALQLRRPDTAN